ncbi:MAG: ATP-binding protein [candidate division Zixibacteria bacterium]|nr:ATP-binding protein [candidate division Zixibacteria bacterium]
MKNKLSKTKKEHFAYGSVIEALSFGLYPDKRHVLREFIQNAFDASISWREKSGSSTISPIEVKIEQPSIFVADHGMGMGEEEVEKYRYLGYSEKDKRKEAGFRGIGKDSGLAVAKKIIVTTSKYGVAKVFTVTIDAQAMLKEVESTRNPPLEKLLQDHGEIDERLENKEAHYTLVELYEIRKDAQMLFKVGQIKDYLQRNCPVPFHPDFIFATEIETRLKENVEEYHALDILLNGQPLFKPFPSNYTRPEYEEIFASDEDGSPLIAECWYCGHTEKGQFEQKEDSGLLYRLKNFAIGDRHLTRKTLWHATPERAFYFFGEIHVLDSGVTPSADRGDFEDNDARNRLYNRCRRISQVLNRKAGAQSARRRFGEKTDDTLKLLDDKETQWKQGTLKEVLRPDVNYQIRKSVEDLAKRLRQTEGKKTKTEEDHKLIEQSKRVISKTKTFLRKLEQADSRKFYRVDRALRLNQEAKKVYEIVTGCLREEFRANPELLERVIQRIDDALVRAFS